MSERDFSHYLSTPMAERFVHPLALLRAKPAWQRVLLTIAYAIAWLTYVPIKGLLIAFMLLFGIVCAALVNWGTDPTKPLPPRRLKTFYFLDRVYARLLCLFHGLHIRELHKENRDPKANIMVGNHSSHLDALVMAGIGGGSAIVN